MGQSAINSDIIHLPKREGDLPAPVAPADPDDNASASGAAKIIKMPGYTEARLSAVAIMGGWAKRIGPEKIGLEALMHSKALLEDLIAHYDNLLASETKEKKKSALRNKRLVLARELSKIGSKFVKAAAGHVDEEAPANTPFTARQPVIFGNTVNVSAKEEKDK